MDLDFLIDHMKRKLPMSDKVGNAIVAELKKSLELQERVKDLEKYEQQLKTALAPLVEWYNKSKRDFPDEFRLLDVVLRYEGSRGDVNVTSKHLDAIARLVGEE